MKKTKQMFFFIGAGALLFASAFAMAEDLAVQANSQAGGQQEALAQEGPQQQTIGVLQVETEPAGAKVFVAEEESAAPVEIGQSPVEEKCSPHTYWIKISLEGYEDVFVKADVTAGNKTVIRAKLQPANNSARAKRIAGHSLLWPGIGTVITGIVLIEVQPQGEIGVSGFATAGIGVLLTVTGGILLGLAHKDTIVYEQPPLALGPLPDLSGGGISFAKSF